MSPNLGGKVKNWGTPPVPWQEVSCNSVIPLTPFPKGGILFCVIARSPPLADDSSLALGAGSAIYSLAKGCGEIASLRSQ